MTAAASCRRFARGPFDKLMVTVVGTALVAGIATRFLQRPDHCRGRRCRNILLGKT